VHFCEPSFVFATSAFVEASRHAVILRMILDSASYDVHSIVAASAGCTASVAFAAAVAAAV
jgi:hypothetical protein